jgi:CheY-like chemotaxis protein
MAHKLQTDLCTAQVMDHLFSQTGQGQISQGQIALDPIAAEKITPDRAVDCLTAEIEQSPLPAHEAEIPRGTENILFAEDEAFVRGVASEVLHRAGYRVWTASCPADALRTYDRLAGEVDLLIADVVLPGKSGRALANELRECSPNLAVLLISGYALGADEARRWGDEYLPKPFSAESLLAKVRQVLDGRKPDPIASSRAGGSGSPE